MFNLSLDIDEDMITDNIDKDYLEILPKELQSIVKEIRTKSKGKKCPKLESIDSGSFGSIEISKNTVKKVLSLIQPKHHKILLEVYKFKKKKSQLYFLINRLNNYCRDIKLFVDNTRKIFPNNFVKIYKCNLCEDTKKGSTPNVYVEMALGKGKNLSNVLKQKTLPKKELESIFIQVYYISMTLNMKKLYHNDLKPANIIIAKSDHIITYDALKAGKEIIKMKLPKGSYYPIIVDYDLISKNKPETVYGPTGSFISPGSPDYSFFTATTDKIDIKYSKIINSLPDFDSIPEMKKGIVEMYNAMKKYNKILTITHSQTGGRKNKK